MLWRIFHCRNLFSCEKFTRSSWNSMQMFWISTGNFLYARFSSSFHIVLHVDIIPHSSNLKVNFLQGSRPLPSFSITKKLPLSITMKVSSGMGKSCNGKLNCSRRLKKYKKVFFILPTSFSYQLSSLFFWNFKSWRKTEVISLAKVCGKLSKV